MTAASATGVRTRSLRAVLAGAIDYAGLFPPASLSMPAAVAAYAAYRAGSDVWALGRFVISTARLDEFGDALRAWRAERSAPNEEMWRLSALVAGPGEGDVARVVAFNRQHSTLAIVDGVEIRAESVADIQHLGSPLPRARDLFVEVSPAAETLEMLIGAVRRIGAGAKIRMGGVTPAAFPAPEAVRRFLRACHDAGVPFKATAGLHHPIRAEYALTYEPGAPVGTMFGYLNVMIAAALVHRGATNADVLRALSERDASAVAFDDDGFRWREFAFPLASLQAMRRDFMRGLGSCSFREPLEELGPLGLA